MDISIDLATAEGYNAKYDTQQQAWVARGAYDLVDSVVPPAPYSSANRVYGFSVRTASGGSYHYIVYINAADGMLIVSVRDEYLADVGTVAYAPVVGDINTIVVTHAVVYNQIIINSPQFPYPLHAYIGAPPTQAVAVDPIPANPDLPALSLLTGVVGKFADRVVWGIGNQILISSPGTDPRILQANNAIGFSGKVTDIVQDPGGSLVIGTTDGLYLLPSDGLQYATYQGNISKIPINTLQSGNIAANAKTTLVLAKDGVYTLDGSYIPILQPNLPRRITQSVLVCARRDMRYGRIISDGTGWYYIPTQTPNTSVFLHLDHNLTRSWIDDFNLTPLISLLNLDGNTLLLARSGVYIENAQINHQATVHPLIELMRTYTCAIHFPIPLPPHQSNTVRHCIITTQNEARRRLQCYVFGLDDVVEGETEIVPRIMRCNIDDWELDRPIYSPVLRSTQLDFALRTDGRWAEVGIDGGQAVFNVLISLQGQAKGRR